jgi:RNA polymerase sigma-70 factor (ECF subfamily)
MVMTDPDLPLLQATGRGDREAFELLVQRYQGPLLSFIARLIRDRSMAEDLAQETFLRVYRAASRFEARSRVSTWVFRIAYRLALNELGRLGRRESLGEALRLEGAESGLGTSPDPAGRMELEEELMTALGHLPDNQRAALLLRVNEGMTYLEIGEVLGVTIPSVESLLFRARENLRESLGYRKKKGAKR